MERLVYNKLIEWKQLPDKERKPLIVQGARQVGKTWLLETFGHQEFESVAEINFEEQKQLISLFEEDFDTERILRTIQFATGVNLKPGKTLIIFDEIQEAPRGLLALKYLLKHAPQYHIVAAGSLLGVALHKEESFPVGKVTFLDVYPLSFEEFLMAMGQDDMVTLLRNADWETVRLFKERFIDYLRQYYYVGGMPEAVQTYVRTHNANKVRKIQQDLLRSYDRDFSKHPPKEVVPRLKMVWNNIGSQLAKENKKFIYNAIRKGARAKDFELAIEWLVNAGAVYKVTRVRQASLPLKGFEDMDVFKLFAVDIGLLGAMVGLDANTLLSGNEIFTQYKGALTEQYVLQQLQCEEGLSIHYWASDGGMAEVDFVVQIDGRIVPVEVKAEENLKSKSLKSYNEKYKPKLSVRMSMSDFRQEPTLTNLPLYAANWLKMLE